MHIGAETEDILVIQRVWLLHGQRRRQSVLCSELRGERYIVERRRDTIRCRMERKGAT